MANENATFAVVSFQGNRNNPNSGSSPDTPGGTIEVVVDREAPVLTVEAPENNSLLAMATPRVEASFADNLSGIDTASVHLCIDTVEVTAPVVSMRTMEEDCHFPSLESAKCYEPYITNLAILFASNDGSFSYA